MPLLLKVATTRQITVDEPILQHAPAADAGSRRVIYTVSYINGQETRRDPVSITTMVKPKVHLDIN